MCWKTPDEMAQRLDDMVGWATWADTSRSVTGQVTLFADQVDPSVAGTVTRLATAVAKAVDRHT